MNAAIVMDKSGRLVLPKKVRERLHLRPGARLDAKVVGDKLELTEAVDEAAIEIMPDGLPAIIGWEGFDAAAAVRESREEQLERLEGTPGDDIQH